MPKGFPTVPVINYTPEECLVALRRHAEANGGWLARVTYEKLRSPEEPAVTTIARICKLRPDTWEAICQYAGIAHTHALVMKLDADGNCTDADAVTALSQHHKALFLYSKQQRHALAVWCVRKVYEALGKPELLLAKDYDAYQRLHRHEIYYLQSYSISKVTTWYEACRDAGVNSRTRVLQDEPEEDPIGEIDMPHRETPPAMQAGFVIKQGETYTERRQYNWETRGYETVKVYKGWFGA